MQHDLFAHRANASVRLDVRPEPELLPGELSLLSRAELAGLCPVEAWSPLGTNAQMAYASHGLFRYFGKFPPPIATHLVSSYTDEVDLVSDPMCGSGTTGVECLLLGRSCRLCDINPLSLLLARVKTRYLHPEKLQQGLKHVLGAYGPLSAGDDGFTPAGLRNPEHWFLPDTMASLRGLRAAIFTVESEDVREFLLVAFLSAVRRVSRATTQQGRLFLDAKTALRDALPTFTQKVKRGIRAVSELRQAAEAAPNVDVFDHDIRLPFPEMFAGSSALAILHPPYFNAYKYSRVNSLELAWLGVPSADVRRREVREFFKIGKVANLDKYLDDMVEAFEHTAALLRCGGVLALMIGDAILKGEHIPVTRRLLERLVGSSCRLETIALRVPKYTEATWVASQRRDADAIGIKLCDYVLVFRKQ